ncbi:MAG TPA: GtrA family protein [Burkholderiales bacterium]|nr:GtrA family protein [Burkholderiales bacterium]
MSVPIELSRFAAVGLLSNVVLYLLYLAITALGIGPKGAVTLIYCVGVLQSFVLNKNWTFQHEGLLLKTLIRYWTIYLSAYFLNLILLILLVDVAGFAHQIVQAILVGLIATLTFVLQKFWVFRTPPPP